MRLLESLKSVFNTSSEPIVLENIVSAEEVFRQERAERLDEIDEEADNLREKAEVKVNALKEDLKELKEFKDPKDRAIIEDNIANFVEDRQRLLKGFKTDKSIEELHAELEELLREVNSTNEKQGAVLEEANVGDRFSSSLKDLSETETKIEEFIENKYVTRERLESIKSNTEKIKKLKEELNSLNEKEPFSIDNLQDKIDNKEQETNQLEDSGLKEEFEDLREELENTEHKREEVLENIGQAIGRMERGLKKMLHEGKIRKVSSEGSEALRNIRDGEKQELLNKNPEIIEEATEALEKSIDGDFLDSTTRQRLTQGISYFRNFSEKKKRLKNTQDKINDLKNKIEGHEYQENMSRLEKEKEELETKLDRAKQEKREVKDEEKRIQSKKEKLEEEIIQVMEEELNREIILKN